MMASQWPFAVGGLSFVLALFLTPAVRDAFLRLQIVDSPDGSRKRHARPVPRIGGIPIVLSYAASLLALYAVPGWGAQQRGEHGLLAPIMLAAGLVFLTGLLDDVAGLPARPKLVGLVLAASIACLGGVRIESIAGQPLSVWLAVPLTILWLIACSNAFNLMDGLDGLASGMGLFATLTTFLAALLHGNDTLALVTLPLAGSLLGFLRYNFNPASVFLGDCGSLLIGFLLGCYGVIWSQKSATLLGMTAPLLALAVPLLDVGLAVARRWLRNEPIFWADRSHIHHKLLERGLTHRGVVLVLYGATGLCAALSLLQSVAGTPFAGLVIVLFCAATWTGIQHLGYLEFGGARRALRTGAFRRLLTGQIVLHGLETSLHSAVSVDECWNAVRETSRQLGFAQIEASFYGRRFAARFSAGMGTACWRLRLPLETIGYLNVSRDLDASSQPAVLAPFIELIHRCLAPRLRTLRNPAGLESQSILRLAPRVGAGKSGERAPASL